MMAITTIQIEKNLKSDLDGLKLHPRETYNEIIERLLEDQRELNEKTKLEIESALEAIRKGRFKTHEQLRKDMGF
jgi:predicted transcriptional regulator